MEDQTINLDERRPHRAGPAACLACGARTVAVAPEAVRSMECATCGDLAVVYLDPELLAEALSEVLPRLLRLRGTRPPRSCRRCGEAVEEDLET